MNLTKDQRTVFVSQLTQKVKEKHLKRYFTKVGKVRVLEGVCSCVRVFECQTTSLTHCNVWACRYGTCS